MACTYVYEKQFECLKEFGSTKEAKAYAAGLIGKSAKEHGLGVFWDGGDALSTSFMV